METFPVFGCELRSEFAEFSDFVFFELATQVAVGVFLAVFCEATVEIVAAVGRCVGGNVDFFDFAVCGGIGFADFLLQLKHCVGFKLACAYVRLID